MFAHGCGHVFMAFYSFTSESRNKTPYQSHETGMEVFYEVVGMMTFWIALLWSFTKSMKIVLPVSILYTWIFIVWTPNRLALPLVQTLTIIAMTLIALFSDVMLVADMRYSTPSSVIVGIPFGLMGWVESLTCEKFLIHIGGHFWYDVMIPITLCIYFYYAKRVD